MEYLEYLKEQLSRLFLKFCLEPIEVGVDGHANRDGSQEWPNCGACK